MKEKRKTKQILCGGLAFCGEEEMEMLHAYALDGWIFRKFSGLSYVLYKEEPQDLIFSYDLNKVKKEDAQEYLDLFAAAGWEQITCNSSSTWFFMAKQGTPWAQSIKPAAYLPFDACPYLVPLPTFYVLMINQTS